MITGVGVDIVEVERIGRMLSRWNERFCERLFTPFESSLCKKKKNIAQCLAVRFAAKEALAKALGHGWCEHFCWTDVEIRNDPAGKPYFKIQGKTKKLVDRATIHLSLSHTDSIAVAMVVVEKMEY